jgi:hypothetical protein
MKLVSTFGMVYRVTNAGYRDLLKQIVENDSYDLRKVNGRCLGVIEHDLTNVSVEEAADLLEGLKS